jgi:DNA-binding NarL/FixJ family response regulator
VALMQSAVSDWPAAVASLDETLRRLRDRLTSAEADLRLARECYETMLHASCALSLPTTRRGQLFATLTPQERRIANLVALGMSNADIAARLHVSVHTVKSHVKNVLDKLWVRSRWQLVDLSRSQGEI